MAEAFTSSFWPLLSGSHAACWTGESVRIVAARTFGDSTGFPETVHVDVFDSNVSVVKPVAASS